MLNVGEGITNPLTQLQAYGQSIWMDNLSRHILKTGELRRLVDENGVTGLTSNPTIFEKAIDGSADYDEDNRMPAPPVC